MPLVRAKSALFSEAASTLIKSSLGLGSGIGIVLKHLRGGTEFVNANGLQLRSLEQALRLRLG